MGLPSGRADARRAPRFDPWGVVKRVFAQDVRRSQLRIRRRGWARHVGRHSVLVAAMVVGAWVLNWYVVRGLDLSPWWIAVVLVLALVCSAIARHREWKRADEYVRKRRVAFRIEGNRARRARRQG